MPTHSLYQGWGWKYENPFDFRAPGPQGHVFSEADAENSGASWVACGSKGFSRENCEVKVFDLRGLSGTKFGETMRRKSGEMSYDYIYIYKLIDLLIDWLIYWLIDWFIYWLIDWFIDWLIYWLIDWLIYWLIDWWFIDWLIDRWSIFTWQSLNIMDNGMFNE